MRKSAVINHHKARRDEDIARLVARKEQVLEHPDASNKQLFGEALRKYSLSTINPLPSLYLMQKVMSRLYLPEDFYQPDSVETPVVHKQRRQNVGEFITGHILPVLGLPVTEPVLSARLTSGNGGTCLRVETTFGQLLSQVRRKKTYHPKAAVYFDPATSLPIILRKTYDNPSGLTLQPISADGVYVPAGTVVGFSYRHEDNNDKIDGQFEPMGRANYGGATYTSYSLEPQAQIEPMRLTAWAFDEPADRALFALRATAAEGGGYDIKDYDRQRANMLEKTSLADFQQAAARIMEITGVTT